MKYKSKQGALYVLATLILIINSVALASDVHRNSGHQKWRPGWDVFEEQLDYNASEVFWKRSHGGPSLLVTYTLRGATPNRQYQVGISIFDICRDAFGQFPSLGGCV